jgi:gag-polyprotein putative aspartyl protease
MRGLVRPLMPDRGDKWLLQVEAVGLGAYLLAVFLIFCSPAHSSGISESQRIYRSEIQLSPYNLIFTKIKLGGFETVALIDSGAYYAAEISPGLARNLGITLSENQTDTFRGHDGKILYPKSGYLNSMFIGTYEVKHVKVKVVEGHIERIAGQVNTDFDVILGWGILSQSYLVIDYKRLSLMFSDGPIDLGKGQISMEYSVINRAPVVRGTLSEGEAQFLLDTGAPICSIDTNYAEVPAGKVVTKQLLLADSKFSLEWRVKDLSVIKNSMDCAGVIGNNLLKSYAVYFDPKNKIIKLH